MKLSEKMIEALGDLYDGTPENVHARTMAALADRKLVEDGKLTEAGVEAAKEHFPDLEPDEEEKPQMGFLLTSPVVLRDKRGEKVRLENGDIVPVVWWNREPRNERERRAPFVCFHEHVGHFLLGKQHVPVTYDPKTKEFTAGWDFDDEEEAGS